MSANQLQHATLHPPTHRALHSALQPGFAPARRALGRAASLALAVTLALPVSAQTPAATPTPTPTAPAAALRAQDVAVLAASCANCHGPNGQSTGGIAQLRGLPADYLLTRLQAFKAGTAQDATVMTRLAKGYDDEQLKALAQWFSKESK